MEREHVTTSADLIELGSVSDQTQGAMGEMIEPIGFWHRTGISDQ